MRITSKGQVTIPAEIRERAGLLPHTEADFQFDGEVVRIVRAKSPKGAGRGARHRRSCCRRTRRCCDEHGRNHGADTR